MAAQLKRQTSRPSSRPPPHLRIGFLAGDMSLGGGVNRVICDLANLFAERLGAEVTIVSVGQLSPPAYPLSPEVNFRLHKGAGFLAYLKAISQLRAVGCDLLIGSWTQDNLMLILAGLAGGRPIVIEHTSWHFHPTWLRVVRRLLYPFARAVVVLNPSDLAHYRQHLANVRLVPNPVTVTSGLREARREKLIVAIGHLESRKNFQDAVSAMALSGLEADGWSLAIIGSGPDQANLGALIAEKGLKNTTIHAPTSDIQSWYERASLTLVTARLEVFSLVLAEAMAAGVVPVAYAADGPSYLLQDFPDHLVSIRNVEELAEKLAQFAGARDLSPLRERLSESIKRRFSPEVVVDCWRALLEDIVGRE